jgi:hypothetical protein
MFGIQTRAALHHQEKMYATPGKMFHEAGYGGEILVGGKIREKLLRIKSDTTKDTMTEDLRLLYTKLFQEGRRVRVHPPSPLLPLCCVQAPAAQGDDT